MASLRSRVKEALKRALTSEALRRHLEGDLADAQKVVSRVTALSDDNLNMVIDWVRDLIDACDQHDRLWNSDAQVWRNAIAFGVNLPELKKLRSLRERAVYVWVKERPGLLKVNGE